MSHLVRRALESDAAALVALRKKVFAETSFMLLEPSEFTQSDDDERQRIAYVASRSNSLLLVCESANSLIGFLSAAGGEHNRRRHSATLALGVLKTHWRRGIASAMLAEALAWSRAAGLKRVELTVHTTNFAGLTAYLRAGFQVEGIRRCSLVVDGIYVDEYLMSVIHGA
jgi:RimJ/RimL family protein N-acetyltransferase